MCLSKLTKKILAAKESGNKILVQKLQQKFEEIQGDSKMSDYPKNFDSIMVQTFKHEGGYVDDPDDAGGETNFGISKRAYPDVDIKNLTEREAKGFYYKDYWLRAKCDKLPDSLQNIFFDMCVNFGQGGATKVLQEASNQRNRNKIAVDGKIGPATIGAAKNLEAERLRAFRVLRFARIVENRKSQMKYWYGWFKRAISV